MGDKNVLNCKDKILEEWNVGKILTRILLSKKLTINLLSSTLRVLRVHTFILTKKYLPVHKKPKLELLASKKKFLQFYIKSVSLKFKK